MCACFMYVHVHVCVCDICVYICECDRGGGGCNTLCTYLFPFSAGVPAQSGLVHTLYSESGLGSAPMK